MAGAGVAAEVPAASAALGRGEAWRVVVVVLLLLLLLLAAAGGARGGDRGSACAVRCCESGVAPPPLVVEVALLPPEEVAGGEPRLLLPPFFGAGEEPLPGVLGCDCGVGMGRGEVASCRRLLRPGSWGMLVERALK